MSDIAFEDPRKAILKIEACVREICEEQGADPAEGTMLLLTAAAHMTDTYTNQSAKEWSITLAECLGAAMVAAHDFFGLRTVEKEKSQ
tara:strand:+ start:35 stop:298 length:264 start_codon:yes stop_codon:yes gene_type:complete